MRRAILLPVLAGVSLGVVVAAAVAFATSRDATTANGGQIRAALIADGGEASPTLRELEADGLSDHVVRMLELDPATIQAVGSFAPTTGGRHEVYLARTTAGRTCLVEERVFDTPGNVPGIYGGGCDPGPLGPGDLKLAVSAQGDPDAPGTRGVSIVGVAGSEVRRVAVILRDGRRLPVELNDRNAFQYSVAPASAGRASAPLSFEARDASGRVLDTTPVH